MAKYSLELKQQVAEHYLSGVEGTEATTLRFHVARAQVRQWASLYRVYGIEGIKKRYTFYSVDFKQRAIQAVLQDNCSLSDACARFNISSLSTLLQWLRLYNDGGIDALLPKRRGRPRVPKPAKPQQDPEKPLEEMTREELLQELEYRRAEVAYLKKLDALIQSRKSAAKTTR